MTIRTDNEEYVYAVGGGVIKIDKEKVTLLLNSVERSDEIDVSRAQAAKQRAEERLNSPSKDDVDVNRAKIALLKALNRINIVEK